MALFLNDSLSGDLVRGGQVLLHFVRMLLQVLQKFSKAMVLAAAVAVFFTFLLLSEPYERYLGWRYVGAVVATDYLRHGEQETPFERSDGSSIEVTERALRNSRWLRSHATQLLATAGRSLWIGAVAVLLLFAAMVGWVWRNGYRQRRDEFLRGGRILAEAELAHVVKADKRAGRLRISSVPLVEDSETSHILFTGATGTGKSTAIYQILEQIRSRGDRFICYSPSGDFIERFYRPERDTVLNPFDARCPSWDLWKECAEPYHYEALARALIPDKASEKDPFWPEAARTVMACLGQETARRGEHTIPRFLELLLGELEPLHEYLKNTEAAATLNPNSDKAALSVLMTVVTYGRSLRYLPQAQGSEPFHIRQWVHADKGDASIFLTAKDEQLGAVSPLLTAWLDLFTSSMLSLSESRTRRVWLIIDELPSLHRIPSLPKFLAQGRKFGGCGVLGFQQVSQLRDTYGQNGAQTLVGGCATWLCMRQNDPETAEWIAKSFGDVEFLEAQQGYSYGENEMRAGVTLQPVRKTKPLILPSEVMHLDDLQGLIRVPGHFPAGRVQLQHRARKKVATAFIPSTVPRVWSRTTQRAVAPAAVPQPAPTVAGELLVDEVPTVAEPVGEVG